MTLLLMAAGNASRYGTLKQFDALGVNGEFLMEYNIFNAIKNGCKKVVVVTKADKKDFIQEYLIQRLPKKIKVVVVAQEIADIPQKEYCITKRAKPWGTAHAVWAARNVINENFIIINADDYYGFNAFKTAESFIKSNVKNQFALVGYALKDTLSKHGTVSRGVCNIEQKELKNIKEYTKIRQKEIEIIDEETLEVLAGEALVSMNFWICTPLLFNFIEAEFVEFFREKNDTSLQTRELYLPNVIQNSIKNNKTKVTVLTTKSQWFGLTYYADKQEAIEQLQELTKQNKYPLPLWK